MRWLVPLLLLPSAAVADVTGDVLLDPAASIPDPGCYSRIYDATHLAAHPEQVVASMRLHFVRADSDEVAPAPPWSVMVALLVVDLAEQGHVTRESAPGDGFPNGFGGQEMYAMLLCPGNWMTCGSECMGAAEDTGFTVTGNDGKTLTIGTESLPVGQGQDCGGFTDITEGPGQLTTFVLDRVDNAVCDLD